MQGETAYQHKLCSIGGFITAAKLVRTKKEAPYQTGRRHRIFQLKR